MYTSIDLSSGANLKVYGRRTLAELLEDTCLNPQDKNLGYDPETKISALDPCFTLNNWLIDNDATRTVGALPNYAIRTRSTILETYNYVRSILSICRYGCWPFYVFFSFIAGFIRAPRSIDICRVTIHALDL